MGQIQASLIVFGQAHHRQDGGEPPRQHHGEDPTLSG
jgi:hypothetical protein